MTTMRREIGSFDAKTHLSRILREVEKGYRYTITVRGRPVAELGPAGRDDDESASLAVQAMQALERVQGVGTQELLEWIAEGRR